MSDMLEYETMLYKSGAKYICGIDEAGRGPLAGPVCAAAVILPKDILIDGINDSKKLSPKKRELLYDEITEKASAWACEFVFQDVIDKINIRQATHLAMQKAVNALEIKPDVLIIDGNDGIEFADIKSKYIIKGDTKSQTIAAASIIAKVTRDRYMTELAKAYPQYGFEKHKGYGTKAHCEAIREYGVSEVHRKSFMTSKVLGVTNEQV